MTILQILQKWSVGSEATTKIAFWKVKWFDFQVVWKNFDKSHGYITMIFSCFWTRLFTTQFISWSHDNYFWIYARKMAILRIFQNWSVGSEDTSKDCFLKSQVIWFQSGVKNFWQVEWLCCNNFFMSLDPYLYYTIYFVVMP